MDIRTIFQNMSPDESFDEIMDEISQYGGFSDTSIEFPDISQLGEHAELVPHIANLYVSPFPYSEMAAIYQYMVDGAQFQNNKVVFGLLYGVGIIEMRHMDNYGELLRKISPKLNNTPIEHIAGKGFSSVSVPLAKNHTEAMLNGRLGEQITIDAIDSCQYIIEDLKNASNMDDYEIIIQFLNKVRADEIYHRDNIFNKWLQNNN